MRQAQSATWKRTFGLAATLGVVFAQFGACGSEDSACDPATSICSDGSSGSDGTTGFVPPDGSILLPDGAIQLPDGAIVQPDGAPFPTSDAPTPFVPPPGSVLLPDGGLLLPDGAVIQPDGGPIGCVPSTCQGKIYACGDCIDNDNDGKLDSADPECLGPCDQSESTFDLAIPSGGAPICKVDCYYDGDNGSGNDTCEWNHACDPHETPTSYYPRTEMGDKCAYDEKTKFPGNRECADVRQTLPDGGLGGGQPGSCINYCTPLTPNGCDCFGCCTFPALANTTDPVTGAKPAAVYLGSRDAQGNLTCTADKVTDPTACHPCQQVPSCNKPCGRCQLCIGKNSVPDDCFAKVDAGSGGDSGSGSGSDSGSGSGSDSGSGSGSDSGGGGGGGGGGATPTCPQFLCLTGQTPCGLATCAPCPGGTFCNTGCCIPNPN